MPWIQRAVEHNAVPNENTGKERVRSASKLSRKILKVQYIKVPFEGMCESLNLDELLTFIFGPEFYTFQRNCVLEINRSYVASSLLSSSDLKTPR